MTMSEERPKRREGGRPRELHSELSIGGKRIHVYRNNDQHYKGIDVNWSVLWTIKFWILEHCRSQSRVRFTTWTNFLMRLAKRSASLRVPIICTPWMVGLLLSIYCFWCKKFSGALITSTDQLENKHVDTLVVLLYMEN